jgi:hypothetical protein
VTLGRQIRFGFLPMLASVWVWIGIAGWAAVAALLVLALVGVVRRRPAVGPDPAAAPSLPLR